MTAPAAVLARFDLTEPPVPLFGDVGARRYYRAANAILVVYPESGSRAQANWTAIHSGLAAAGLRVPRLLDDAPDLGAALVEDLGSRDLASELGAASTSQERLRLLDEAEELLLGVRVMARDVAARNPPFDTAFFEKELAHTRTWAFEAGGERPLPEDVRRRWDELAHDLAHTAASPEITGDPVPTHRDFHVNNLMRASDGRLALIDFQDLTLGPPDYDPVSLRFERAAEATESDGDGYHEAVLLQRAWKVLGTFEKMLRKGRTVYQPHLEGTLRVIRRRTSPGSRFVPLLAFLERLSPPGV